MTPRALAVLGALLAVSALGLALTGSSAAGDRSVLLYPQDENRTVAPGEDFEIDVVLSYHGTASGEGLENASLVAEYDASLVQVTHVEPAGWFADGTGEVATVRETDRQGSVRLSQELDPPGDGVVGTARFATLTLEVPADAPAGNATVDFGESSAAAAGGFPLPVFESDPVIRIDPDAEATADSDETGAQSVPTAVVALVVAAFTLVAAARRRRLR